MLPVLDSPPHPGEDAPLYEKRRAVFPKAVDGLYRRIKWGWMGVTLAIYYGTPWLRWDRGPYAPDQAVLVDLAHRRFYMFGIEIWPHEFYFVAGLLIMAGIGLFIVTSAVGRAWCGYSCPQTVWTDLFQHVDRLIDGDRNAQLRLQRSGWTMEKIGKRTLKWSIYLFVSFWTGGAWILYFADAPSLVRDFWSGQAAPVAYATVATLTATTFVLGGVLREQVCIYMCPWPRIQTAMLDENSLTVTYKDWRGEPRGSVKQHTGGDCVDCNQCVAVCPTGIDIREGPQVGCITCALCIDACDAVMAQVGRAPRLIDYVTLQGAEAEKAGAARHQPLKSILRPRVLVYFGVWCAIGAGLLFALGTRRHIDISADRDRNPPYMVLSDGAVRNAYTVKLRNMESRPRAMEIALLGLDRGVMWSDDMPRGQAARALRRTVAADQAASVRLYVTAPAGTPAQDFRLTVRALDAEGGSDTHKVRFDGPGDE
ncbi:cytochrome c oxidase accessory protein CcoG [Novosphingobium sp. JCM 18896]|uniref:cytochrome c oxidase accessory protein CcoG n=1 Tax=Novosphingobium sp. JCM 18896 TaxID=2989731 RepID=UPI002222FA7F|nr:cytochrome c oxidase accessory protein CcoG [Novosphingobium sp. JCM 18896]MCW1428981.1 cytochrome c oxidase accessory protein CcoG [Novosphingobium sp. JCM 18896]